MRRVRLSFGVLPLCLGLCLTACFSRAVDPEYTEMLSPDVDLPSASTLGAGDRIKIRVYEDPKMGGEFEVGSDGRINFPLIGKVGVESKTCSQVEDALTDRINDGLIRDPSVTCSVVAFNSKKVFVFGEVKKPGAFSFEDSMSVVQALTLAGGFTDLASKNDTSIVRVYAGKKVRARVPMEGIIDGEVENLVLLPGDIIFVPQSIY